MVNSRLLPKRKGASPETRVEAIVQAAKLQAKLHPNDIRVALEEFDTPMEDTNKLGKLLERGPDLKMQLLIRERSEPGSHPKELMMH